MEKNDPPNKELLEKSTDSSDDGYIVNDKFSQKTNLTPAKSDNSVSYREMFPRKEATRKSLIKPFNLENFQETIDYRKLTNNILRRSWIVALCGVLFGLLGHFVLEPILNHDQSYTATTHLLYKQRRRSVSEGSFNITTIKDMIIMPKNCQAAKTLLNTDLSVEQIQSMSVVEVNKKSNFLKLHVTANDDQLATQLANRLAEMAVNNNRSFYKQKAELLMKGFREQAQKARLQVKDAQQQIVNFQNKNKILDINSAKKLLVEAIADEEASLLEMENIVITKKSDLAALDRELKETPEKIRREVHRQDFLVHEMQSVQRQYIKLKAEYGEKNPKVMKVKKELDLLKQSVANNSKNEKDVVFEPNPKIEIIKTKQKEAQLSLEKATQYETSLKASLKEKYSRLKQLPKLQSIYTQLVGEMEIAEKQVAELEKKANEVELSYRSPLADFEVYEAATAANPNTQIDNSVFIFGGVIFGSLISFLIILLMEIFDHRLYTRKEIEANYNAPCLSVIPTFHQAQMSMLNSPLGGHVQHLAERMAQLIESTGPQVLAFCSTTGKEGKSSITHELSKYYSRLGLKTVYMDFNHRSNEFFENTMDISSFLNPDKEDIDDLFSTHDNLSRAKFDYSEEMDDSLKRMGSKQLIHELKEKHDIILIDTPGVLDEDYAGNAIALADEVIFIVRSGVNTKTSIDKALTKLEERGIYPFGLILNAVDKRFMEK